MSKIVNFQIECPCCKKEYMANVFRTLWGDGCTVEDFECRLTDDTNVVTCPHCGHAFRLPLGLMYVDVKRGVAVWWEPQYDEGIDSDTKGYAKMFGADSFYAQAPRVKDWEEFKNTIRRYYKGELKANPITKFDFRAIKGTDSRTKRGCLGVSLLIVFSLPIAGLSYWGLGCLL